MQKRLRRIARVVEVQETMKRLEEAELARVNREVQDVEAKRRHLVEDREGAPPFQALFHDSRSVRLQALAVEEARLRAEAETRSETVLAAAVRHKQTEQLSKRLSARWKDLSERRAWAESLDEVIGAAGRGASLPPATGARTASAATDAGPSDDPLAR